TAQNLILGARCKVKRARSPAPQSRSARGHVTDTLKEATPMDTVGPSVTVRFVLREDEIASAYRTLSFKRPLFWVVSLLGVYVLVQGALALPSRAVLVSVASDSAGRLC